MLITNYYWRIYCQIGWLNPCHVLAQAKTLCFCWRDPFTVQICTANHRANAETRAAQVYSMVRSGELGNSQINFSIQFGLRHHVYSGIYVKERESEKEGGIFMAHLRTGVWFVSVHGTEQDSLSVPVWSFPLVMANVMMLVDVISMLMCYMRLKVY